MSVKVDLDKLAKALADFTFGYLITVGGGFRAHTVAVDAEPARACSRLDPSAGAPVATRTTHPDVTIVWPPNEPGGYALIVDSNTQIVDDRIGDLADNRGIRRRGRARHPDGLRVKR